MILSGIILMRAGKEKGVVAARDVFGVGVRRVKRFVRLGEIWEVEVVGEVKREEKGLGIVRMDMLEVEWVGIRVRGLICFGRGLGGCEWGRRQGREVG
jgi:hypothetical protein